MTLGGEWASVALMFMGGCARYLHSIKAKVGEKQRVMISIATKDTATVKRGVPKDCAESAMLICVSNVCSAIFKTCDDGVLDDYAGGANG